MEKYEYKTLIIPSLDKVNDFNKKYNAFSHSDGAFDISPILEEEINEMGMQGWELVNTIPYTYKRTLGIPIYLLSVFKRKIK